MPILLSHLKDVNIDRSVKVIIISLIGDTFLLTKSRFAEFMEESLSLLEEASHLAIKDPEEIDSDPDTAYY